jgi:hypothetical protein
MGFAPGLLIAVTLLLADGPQATRGADVVLHGKVVTLGAALKALGIDVKPDPEPAAREAVVLGEDRAITPLFRDDASRALFLDERLRDRPVEVRGRRFPGVPYLQVSSFRVEHEGSLQTPEYFCSVCSITERFPQTCPCCQGPMELRWQPKHR